MLFVSLRLRLPCHLLSLIIFLRGICLFYMFKSRSVRKMYIGDLFEVKVHEFAFVVVRFHVVVVAFVLVVLVVLVVFVVCVVLVGLVLSVFPVALTEGKPKTNWLFSSILVFFLLPILLAYLASS